MTEEMTQLKLRLKTTWMTGDYERFARFMEPGAQEFCPRLNLPCGFASSMSGAAPAN